MRRLVFAVAVLCVALLARSARAAASNPLGSYDFFPSAVEGSARYVGLGGSIVAAPDDYAATFINPAGLGGLAGGGVDFGADSSNVDNFVVDPSAPKSRAVSDPLKFSFYGARFVSDEGWGIGLAAQTPYVVDDRFSGTAKLSKGSTFATGLDQTEIQAKSIIYSVGVADSYLDKKLSVGLTVNYIQVTEKYDFSPVFNATAPVHQQAVSDAFSADLGVLARPCPWLRVGAVYKMSYRAPFDPSRNNSTLGTFGKVSAFREGKSPDRLSFGLALSPNSYWNLFLQGSYTFPINDALIIGSNLFPSVTETLAVQRSGTFGGNWGLEFIPINEPDFAFRLWAGGYFEDTGIQGGFQRYHRTAGFGLAPWFLTLNMAIDDTNLYDNFTVGLGVDMLQVASRIAKKLGYKLPI